MQQRLEHAIDDELVDLRLLAAELETDRLARLARDVAHREAHALEHFADRHEPDAHHAFANRAQLPLDAVVRLVEIVPRDCR